MGAGSSPGLDEHQQFDHKDLGPSCPSILSCAGGGWWVQGGCHHLGSISLSPGSHLLYPTLSGMGMHWRDPQPQAACGTLVPLPTLSRLSQPCPPGCPCGPSAGPLGNAARGGSAGNIKQVQPLQSPFEQGQARLVPSAGSPARHGCWGDAGPPAPPSPQPCVGWGDTGCTVDGGLWLS